ncbi:MAG TPA: protein kinase [Gemmataceae bacterium]
MNPHDALNDEEQFTLLLAGYSEALIGGRNADPADDSSLSAELRQRLQRALDCLRRLRRCRTNGEKNPTVPILAPAGLPFSEGPARGHVGRFCLVRELGRGGCGIVFLAFDPLLRREVALKIPKLDVLLTPNMRQRFQREAQAAARLNHPNLVSVYEIGEADGLNYIVSAYCPGNSLAVWLAQQSTPSPRTAAHCIAALADAVQHVHEHGIWHRDIKPGNILLDPSSSASLTKDDPGFTARLTDFGMAKLLEGGTPSTRSGDLVGTLLYMAPEQARGDSREIGPQTDVYGLGAVLYEMLTGRPPFRGVNDADTLRRVLEAEPARPRKQRPETPRDLETICLKCLEKEAGRRYTSAGALADDLRRFLASEPIQARPAGGAERLCKWARRHPWIAATVCFGCLAALVLLTAGFWLDATKGVNDAKLAAATKRHEARREEIEILRRETQVRQERLRLQNLYADDIRLAGQKWAEGRLEDAVNRLAYSLSSRLSDAAEDPRGFEWHFLNGLARPRRRLIRDNASLYCVAFSPEGTMCATGHRDGAIRLWDPTTGRFRQVLTGHQMPVYALAYSSDGKHLASGGSTSSDGRYQGELFLWDVATLKLRHVFPTPSEGVNSLSFSHDGRTLAAALDRGANAGDEVKLWEIPSGALRATIPFDSAGVASVAFYSKSPTLAVGHDDGSLSLYDAREGRVLATRQGHQRCVWSVACGHTNDSLVSGGHDGMVRLWTGRTADRLVGEYRHDSAVWGVALSPDDRTAASVSKDGVVKLWDGKEQRERFLFALPQEWGRTVRFSPDGKTLAVGSRDGELWLCDVSRPVETPCWLGHRNGAEPREVWAVAFSPDGKTLASAGDDHAVRLWDPATGHERAVLRGHQSLVTSLAFSPDGKWLASSSFDEADPVKLWNAVSGAEIATLHGHTRPVDCLAFSPDSKVLATGGREGTVRLWDLSSHREFDMLRVRKVESLTFSPDGHSLLLASNEQEVFLWDFDRRKERLRLPPHPRGHVAVAVTPDGETFVTGDNEGTVRFWDAETGELRVSSKRHDATVNCLAFSRDGKTLASASFDKSVKLWQTATGRELLTLSHEANRVRWVAFSPDGRMLATAGHDGMLKIYRGAAEEK